MGLVVADRVKELTSTTGTGTYTLAGASPGFQTFASIASDGDTCYYAAASATEWEVGLGTIGSSGSTVARTTILSSSNSGSAVNWGAGNKYIYITQPADPASARTALDVDPAGTAVALAIALG